MYFKSRVEAGQKLATALSGYKDQKTAIIALSDGAVVVGAQIAAQLQCVITMLLMEPIKLPGEPDALAIINQEGDFTYNDKYSSGQIEELEAEYYHYIEQMKREKMSQMNQLLGSGGLIRKDLLRDHVVILVSDGLSNGFTMTAAIEYLKPIRTKRIIIATPIASVTAVDHMHILSDEIQCLGTTENYMNTNHYYDDNGMPSHENIVQMIQDIVGGWNG